MGGLSRGQFGRPLAAHVDIGRELPGNNDACEPPTWSKYRNTHDHAGYHGCHQLHPTATYVYIQLCNDDFPPDTCTKWFMTTR